LASLRASYICVRPETPVLSVGLHTFHRPTAEKKDPFVGLQRFKVTLSAAYGGHYTWESSKDLHIIAKNVGEAQKLARSYLEQYAKDRAIDFEKQVKWVSQHPDWRAAFPGMSKDSMCWCESDARFFYGEWDADEKDALRHRKYVLKHGSLDDDDEIVSLSKQELQMRDDIVKGPFDNARWDIKHKLNEKVHEKLTEEAIDRLRHRARVRMGLYTIADPSNFKSEPFSVVVPVTHFNPGE
jgi:hypothetical protein